jgi:hypothetical protein
MHEVERAMSMENAGEVPRNFYASVVKRERFSGTGTPMRRKFGFAGLHGARPHPPLWKLYSIVPNSVWRSTEEHHEDCTRLWNRPRPK